MRAIPPDRSTPRQIRGLRQLADRIQARAVRRMGEMIQQFNAQGRRTDSLNDGAVQKLTCRDTQSRAVRGVIGVAALRGQP
jgi:hypothetical protein